MDRDTVDRALTKALEAAGKRRGLTWIEVNPDITSNGELREEFARAVLELAATTAAPQVDEQRLQSVADELFDHLRLTDKCPALTRDEFREAAGALIAAYIAAPDAPTDQERAAYWHRQWEVATDQLAECHAKLRSQPAAATAAQPWTTVADGLPEPGEDVLVCNEDALFAGLRIVVRRIVDADRDRWLLDTGDGTREVRNVTAWMKLPPEFVGPAAGATGAA